MIRMSNDKSPNDNTLLLVRGSLEDREQNIEYIKKLANAILQCHYKHNKTKLRYVGAGAGNNADKALIIASNKIFNNDILLAYMPDFTTVEVGGNMVTGIIKETIDIFSLYKDGFDRNLKDENLLLVKGMTKDKKENSEYVKKLANAILQVFSKYGIVNLRYVGAGAGNNADKALIIARTEASKKGDILACIPDFVKVDFDGVEKKGIIKSIVNIREIF